MKSFQSSPNLYQSNNSPYLKLIREESAIFYKASLLIPAEKQSIAWALYVFWLELMPFEYWNALEGQVNFIRKWKTALFFEKTYQQDLSMSLNAWLDLQNHFDQNAKKLVLKVLNGLEICQSSIHFSSMEELAFFLEYLGGSVSLASFYILFANSSVAEEEEIIFDTHILSSINYLGMGILWWELLKENTLTITQSKLFIPLSDLRRFDYREEDFLNNGLENPNSKELTKFELTKIIKYFGLSLSLIQKNTNTNLKVIKEIISFLSNYYINEINAALSSGWTLESKSIPNQSNQSNNWIINGFTKWVKGLN